MATDLNIDGTAMEALVAKAILDALTGDQREQLLKDAIASLLTTPKKTGNYYGSDPKSPLREMFENAAEAVARQHIREHLMEDEAFKSTITDLFTKTAQKLMEGEVGDKLTSAMADAFVKGMRLDRY